MRRALLLGAVLALMGGSAQARPWLTMHRAKQAMIQEAGPPSVTLSDCARHGHVLVTCWSHGDPQLEGADHFDWLMYAKLHRRRVLAWFAGFES